VHFPTGRKEKEGTELFDYHGRKLTGCSSGRGEIFFAGKGQPVLLYKKKLAFRIPGRKKGEDGLFFSGEGKRG